MTGVALADARRQLRALLATLESALAAEAASLAARDGDALADALARKESALAALPSATAAAQPERSTRPDLDAVEQADWHDIQSALERCNQANQTNGMAVQLGRRNVDTLLAMFLGQQPGANVYDARGRVAATAATHRAREQI